MTMQRTLLYLLLVPIVLFEAVVAVLALNPQVSEPFRAYFIDKTTDCNRYLDVSGTYALGETVSLVLPKTAAQTDILRCGWLGPQDTGTWSSGPESRLRFALADPPSAVVLDLELIPFVTEPQPVQTVRITVNGRGLDTIQLEGNDPRHVLVEIPLDIVDLGDERVDVDFTFPSAHSPASASINNDKRLLGIRLLSVKLTRAN